MHLEPNIPDAPSHSPISSTTPVGSLISKYQVTPFTNNANHHHLNDIVPLKPNKPCHQQQQPRRQRHVENDGGGGSSAPKKRRTAQSTSKGSHNPRADNSSNWDTGHLLGEGGEEEDALLRRGELADGNHHLSQSLSTTIGSNGHDSNSIISFHYLKAVGGGVTKRHEPAATACLPTSSFSMNNDIHVLQGTGAAIANYVTNSSNYSRDSIASLPQQRQEHQSIPSKSHQSVSLCSSSSPLRSPEKCTLPLHDYLNTLISSRGYRPKKIPAITLGYRPNPPTPLQLASFGFAVCSTIDRACSSGGGGGGASRLTALLQAGLSPNPTNKFGDSPFLVACKRGVYSLVNAFVEAGAEVRVADGFGRTPLHYAAWADPPCMESARLLLKADARLLFVSDVHGRVPLEYVGKQHRGRWIDFLEGVKDEMWPIERVTMGEEYFPEARWTKRNGGDEHNAGGSSTPSEENNDIPDPKDALPLELAEKVASGHIMPQEAQRQQQERQKRQLLFMQQGMHESNASDSNIDEKRRS